MKNIKTQVVFPESILAQLDAVVPGRKRSEFIVQATEKELARFQFKRSLHFAAGVWTTKSHPTLHSKTDIQEYLKGLRKPWRSRIEKFPTHG